MAEKLTVLTLEANWVREGATEPCGRARVCRVAIVQPRRQSSFGSLASAIMGDAARRGTLGFVSGVAGLACIRAACGVASCGDFGEFRG